MNEREERINTIIANNLVRLLQEKNRTQLELAEYLGVTQASISNWCNGVKMPRMDKIDLICEFFGIRRSQLMSGEDDSSSSAPDQAAVLDPAAERLLSAFWDLNAEGQSNLIEYAEYLHSSGRYKKGSSA